MENKRIIIPAACVFVASVAFMTWMLFQSPEGAASQLQGAAKSATTGSPSSTQMGQNASAMAAGPSTAQAVSPSHKAAVPAVQVANSAPIQPVAPSTGVLPSISPSGTAPAPRAGTIAPTTESNGIEVKAQVMAGGQQYDFKPNELGLFPRVNIGLGDSASVSVAYPGGAPGDLVVVQSEDGGTLADGKTVMQAHLDDNLQVKFPFNSTQEGGIYRVTLRNGFDQKRLEFWGGPAPVVRNATN